MNPLLWQEILVAETDDAGVPTGDKYLDWGAPIGRVRDEEAATAQIEALLLPNPAQYDKTNRFLFMEFIDLDGDGVPDGIKTTLLGPKGKVAEPPVPTIQKLRRKK